MQDYSPFSGGPAAEAAGQGRVMAKVAALVSRWSVLLSFGLIPLLYVPGTVDALDLPKQGLLIVLTIAAVLAWLGRMIIERKASFRRSVVNLLMGVWLVVYGLSAWFSQSRYASFVGDGGQQKAGFVTATCFVLLYFVTINVLKNAGDVKKADRKSTRLNSSHRL